mgnify:CR=1 FL=1
MSHGKAFSGFMNRRGFLGKLTRTAFALGALRLLAAEILPVKAAPVKVTPVKVAAIPRHGSAFSAAFSEAFH